MVFQEEEDLNRRTFLKTSIIAPFFFRKVWADTKSTQTKFIKATPKSFDFLEVKGTYEQIGFQIGKFFSKNIHQIIQSRNKWHTKLLSIEISNYINNNY